MMGYESRTRKKEKFEREKGVKKNKGGDSGSLNNRVLVLRQYLTAELGLLFPPVKLHGKYWERGGGYLVSSLLNEIYK